MKKMIVVCSSDAATSQTVLPKAERLLKENCSQSGCRGYKIHGYDRKAK